MTPGLAVLSLAYLVGVWLVVRLPELVDAAVEAPSAPRHRRAA